MPPRLFERLGMTAWIIGIDRDNPEHWEYAKAHGFWDMTVRRHFERGDVLYFWQAGASLLGAVEVTIGTYEIAPGTWMPWNIDDSKRDNYRFRVDFRVLERFSAGQPRWAEVTRATGVRGATNFGPRQVPPNGERWLSAQVTGEHEISASAMELAEDIERLLDRRASLDESRMERDFRAWVEATVVIRRGQARFRRGLLSAYDGRCAVTGTMIEGILEAAHISPYKGDHTDTVSNGLLLRSDIHTLFDLHLLTVLPDLTVRLAPGAMSAPYAALEGTKITVPSLPPERPDPVVLRSHNNACDWLVENAHQPVVTVLS